MITKHEAICNAKDGGEELRKEAEYRLDTAITNASIAGEYEVWIIGKLELLECAKHVAELFGYSAELNTSQHGGDLLKISWRD